QMSGRVKQKRTNCRKGARCHRDKSTPISGPTRRNDRGCSGFRESTFLTFLELAGSMGYVLHKSGAKSFHSATATQSRRGGFAGRGVRCRRGGRRNCSP